MADDFIKIKTPVFRLSYPDLLEARAYDDKTPAKFGLTMLIPKTADIESLREAARTVARAKWGDKMPKDLRSPFRDGDEKEDEAYHGHWFIKATSNKRPAVFNERVEPIVDASEIYAGCYCLATINPFAYDTKGNRGISFGLLAVQKVRDGEPFSGRGNPADDFEPVSGGGSGSASSSRQPGDEDIPF